MGRQGCGLGVTEHGADPDAGGQLCNDLAADGAGGAYKEDTVHAGTIVHREGLCGLGRFFR